MPQEQTRLADVSARAPLIAATTSEDAARVLVIDDQEPLRVAYARILLRHGYRVEIAPDAASALQALQRGTFDVILSDITMPGMTGIALAEHLRASSIDIPVVLMTGDPDLDTAMSAVQHGVARYLVKPVERQMLVDVVGAAIRLHGIARAERLAEDNKCLRSLVDELNRARAAERAAGRAKSDFLGQMSHELRTPLAHIMGFTELALETELTDEQREYLSTSQRSATALLGLIENVFQFTKLQCGGASLDAETIDARAAIDETMEPLIAAAERKRLAITVDVDASVPMILTGDAPKFRQVIEHVVGNAIKFTKSGGTISVRADVESRTAEAMVVRLSVADSGIGIPEAVLAQVMGAFSQADNSSSRAHGGAGLGLALSVLLVKLMGGGIDVKSAPGAGTTVTFTTRFETPAR